MPLQVLVDKFSHTRFEPSGFTDNPEIPIAKSITDYIFRWLALKFLPSEDGRGRRPLLKPGEAPPSARRPRGPPRCVTSPPAASGQPAGDGVERLHPRPRDRRPALPHLRLDHGAQRRLLQVRQLRVHHRLQLALSAVP